jgi:hypothetical protein
MRQRKATAYPHWGALVQPRPGDRNLPSARRCHENDPPSVPRQGFEPTRPRCRFRGGVPAPRTSAHRSRIGPPVPALSGSPGRLDQHGTTQARAALASSNFLKSFDDQAARAAMCRLSDLPYRSISRRPLQRGGGGAAQTSRNEHHGGSDGPRMNRETAAPCRSGS